MASASRHGATREIAAAIAVELEDAGLEVDDRPVEEVEEIDGYDAVVLGSAVDVGKWLAPARRLAEERAEELSRRPVWLFSSGPVQEGDARDWEGVGAWARGIAEALRG